MGIGSCITHTILEAICAKVALDLGRAMVFKSRCLYANYTPHTYTRGLYESGLVSQARLNQPHSRLFNSHYSCLVQYWHDLPLKWRISTAYLVKTTMKMVSLSFSLALSLTHMHTQSLLQNLIKKRLTACVRVCPHGRHPWAKRKK